MKIRCFVLLLILSLLCGCASNKNPVRANLVSISFNADIEYYNENYSCDCTVDDNGDFSVSVTAPDNLNGLSFVFSDDSSKIMYAGMEIGGVEHFLPESSSVTVLKEIIDKCNGIECDENKRNYSFSGDSDGNKFILTVSPAGLPISLEVPDLGLTVAFKNVTIIK